MLTIFVYLIFPTTFVLIKGKVNSKFGRKLALGNSIICAIIFCIVRAILSGGETIVTSFAPAVLYYFIAKLILIDKSMDTNNGELEDNEDNQEGE